MIDEVYGYMLQAQLEPYLEKAKEWWDNYDIKEFTHTGSFPIEDGPNGMFIRFYRTPKQSPIKGIQAFPYVISNVIDIPKVPGGIRKFIHNTCAKGYTIRDFTLIEKMYLHGTERSGQFICIIPNDKYIVGCEGRFVWVSDGDIHDISSGFITKKIKDKFMRYLV